jgi:Glycosyl transferase family 11
LELEPGPLHSQVVIGVAKTRILRPAARLIRHQWPRPELTVRFRPTWGLGNQLFQIAGSYAIAVRNEVDLVLPRDWAYRPFFSLPSGWFAGPSVTRRCREAWELAIDVQPAWARPHLQDVSLWRGREADIHTLLQPSESVINALSARFSDVLNGFSTTAIHIRRGDYLSPATQLRPCPRSYYEEAFELLAREEPNTQMLVFSDDIEWCRAEMNIEGAVYVSGNPDWMDMALMSRCDHHVCANSTFSWWGAFLSRDERPIAPWLPGVLPDNFKRVFPRHWRLIESRA